MLIACRRPGKHWIDLNLSVRASRAGLLQVGRGLSSQPPPRPRQMLRWKRFGGPWERELLGEHVFAYHAGMPACVATILNFCEGMFAQVSADCMLC